MKESNNFHFPVLVGSHTGAVFHVVVELSHLFLPITFIDHTPWLTIYSIFTCSLRILFINVLASYLSENILAKSWIHTSFVPLWYNHMKSGTDFIKSDKTLKFSSSFKNVIMNKICLLFNIWCGGKRGVTVRKLRIETRFSLGLYWNYSQGVLFSHLEAGFLVLAWYFTSQGHCEDKMRCM